jgi:hypothetical protein
MPKRLAVIPTSRPSFSEVWGRASKILRISTQRELATILEISQPAIADAKKKGTFPADWICKLAITYGISADYLLFGDAFEEEENRFASKCHEKIMEGIDIAFEENPAYRDNPRKNALIELVKEDCIANLRELALRATSRLIDSFLRGGYYNFKR